MLKFIAIHYNSSGYTFVRKKNQLTYFITRLLSLLWMISISFTVKSQALPSGSEIRLPLIQKINHSSSNLKTVSTATCPSSPVMLAVQDTLGNTINNGQTLPCGIPSLFIDANTPNSGVTTPCVQTQFTSLDPLLPASGTETFYEGNTDLLCIGPSSSCIYKIGTGLLNPKWSVDKIFLDPSQQHDFVFCYSGIISILTSVQLQDCWTADSLSPVQNLISASCFTVSLPPNTAIGTASFNINPASAASSLIDYHNGKAYINTGILAPGTYTINYTFTPPLADGCPTVTGVFKFTIAPITVTVNNPTVCAGNTTTLTASGATSYSWSPSAGLSSSTASSVTTTSTTTVYTVTGTKGVCSATATSSITIKPSPTVTVNSANICGNSTATLIANGATNYTWSPSTGLNITNGNTVIASPSTTTIYTVTGKSGGCSSSATSSVTVNTSSTPTLTVNSPTLCTGGTTTLTVSGATNYTWSPAAGLSVTSGNTVTAVTSSTTVYTINGTTGSCYSTTTATITVIPTTTIQVTSNKNGICAGSFATLKASGANTYTWSPAGSLSSSTGGIVAATPTTTTTYTISGSISTCTTIPDTITLTVTPLPIITITPASTVICSGKSTTLTASGANTYSWAPSTGLNTTTGTVVISNPINATTYTITGTLNACSSSTTTTVTVNPTPTLTINSPTLCATGNATLTVGGATNYTWSPSSGLSATNGNIITANTSSTSVYTVNGSIGSCSTTTTTTVQVAPTATIHVTSNLNPICANSSTTLTATGATSYTWSPAITLSSATGISVKATPTSNTTYSITGSSGTCTAIPYIITLTVNPLPIITLNSSPVSVCSGNSATLTTIGASTYSWSPSTGLNTTTGALIIANPSVTTNYSIKGVTNGCSSTKQFTLQINQLPNITITPSFTAICNGAQTTLTALNGISYTWAPANSLNNSATASVIASPTLSTTYTVSATDGNGCSNSSITSVSVSTAPQATPTGNGPLCAGQAITLLSNYISSTANYLWVGPNGFTSSSQNPLITNASSINTGTYTLTIAAGNCTTSNTVAIYVDNIPSTANAGKDTTIYDSFISLNGNIPLIGTGAWSVISGSGSFINSTSANTQVTNLQVGQNILQWTISNGACPVSYDDVTIIVKDFMVPNGFSPNNDGVNDYFEINGLDAYTNVKLQVFNRWGNLVYESDDYKNNWNGKNKSGEDVSDDTYFFTLEIQNKNSVKGYVVLKRK